MRIYKNYVVEILWRKVIVNSKKTKKRLKCERMFGGLSACEKIIQVWRRQAKEIKLSNEACHKIGSV